jgi:UDP-N-acetylglucosamine acyltransferase
MLRLVKNALLCKNITIGKNNYIADSVIIHDNVIIGDNNKIYGNVVIYPNTVIGNNNIIFPHCLIGEFPPINTNDIDYDFSLTKGVTIGNNNIFHVYCGIFSGWERKTVIGDCNRFLGEVYIGHDVTICNDVTIFPSVIIAGFCYCLDHCNIGLGTIVNQRLVIGQYSMIGSKTSVTKHVFPYYINIDNKIHRLNEKKNLPIVKNYDTILRVIYDKFSAKDFKLESIDIPDTIKSELEIYVNRIESSKVNQ